jgi:hypothetical protein
MHQAKHRLGTRRTLGPPPYSSILEGPHAFGWDNQGKDSLVASAPAKSTAVAAKDARQSTMPPSSTLPLRLLRPGIKVRNLGIKILKMHKPALLMENLASS